MFSATLPAEHAGVVLADLLPMNRARDITLVAGGVLGMALMAQIAVPVPGSPVPITGQTLGLVLAAAALGPTRAVAVMGLYILAALFGFPFYSDASGGYEVVVGATGGYVLAFVPAAYLIGLAARRGGDRRFWRALSLFVAGQAVVFAIGVPWLALTTGMSSSEALAAGLYPFILGGLVKAVIAGTVVSGAWRFVGRR